MKTLLHNWFTTGTGKTNHKFSVTLFFAILSFFAGAQTTQTITTTGAGSFTVPAGVTSIYVECWGGGGAGGSRTNSGRSGGGAGGAYAASTLTVTPGATISYSVGNGGVAGAPDGADTWFSSSSTVLAKGGDGVPYNTNGGGTAAAVTASIGDVRYKGGNGRTSNFSYSGGGGSSAGTAADGNNATNQNGANAPAGGGDGGDGRSSNGNGTAGNAPGGGGGGAYRTSGTRYGGNGGDGQIKITYTALTYKAELVGTISYGSSNWCSGDQRSVVLQVKNTGTATWNGGGNHDVNIGIKWNTDGASWTDYLTLQAGTDVLPGSTVTITFNNFYASNWVSGSYTTPLSSGINNISFDLEYIGVGWFSSNTGSFGPGNTTFVTPNINIINIPSSVSASGSPNPVCLGSTFNLTGSASEATSWSWTGPGGFTSSAQNPVITNFGISNAGVYTLTATNACGSSSPVNTASIGYNNLPVLTAPSDVCIGNTVTLTPSTGGTWISNNPSIATVTNSGVVTGVSNGSTSFEFTETATGCSATTSPVTVHTRPTAAITSGSTSVCSNNTSAVISGTVTATGSWTITLSDGSAAVGSGNGTFNISVSPSSTTTYTITNLTDDHCGAHPSDLTGSETVTVNQAVQITTQPQSSQAICSSFPVSFSVTATGTGLTYQWYHGTTALTDNVNISGSQSATLTINQASVSDAGTYYVVVSGASPCSSVTSDNANLTVAQDIEITVQPQPQVKCLGETATFSVTATGSNLSYMWRKGNAPLSNGGNISGVYTSTLTISNVSPADAASNYNVVVSGGGICPQVISVNVSLTVNPIPDAMITPASQSICSGSNVTPLVFSGSVGGTTYNWTRDNAAVTGSIGMSGSGNVTGSLVNSGTVSETVNFSVTPVANGCYGSAVAASVLVYPVAHAIASVPAQTICSGENISSINFTSDVAGTSFSWTRDNPSVTGTIANSGTGNISGSLINPTANPITVTFTVTPTANGCPGTASQVTVLVNPSPVVIATPANQSICNNASITTIALTSATGSTSFSWTRDNPSGITSAIPASGTGNISGSFSNSGTTAQTVTFSIIGTANGCSGSEGTATVVVNPTATASVNTSTQTVCSGENISTITATSSTPGVVFQWTRDNLAVTGMPASGSGSISGTLNNPGNTAATVNFTITPVIDGCPGTPVVSSVVVNAKPTLSVTPSSQFVCFGNALTNIVLSNPNNVSGTTISWTRDNPFGILTSIPMSGTGNISGTITNSNNSNTVVTFTITATAPSGCATTSTATVTLYPQFVAPVISAPQVVCVGSNPAPLTGTPATGGSGSYTYQWQQATNSGGPWTNVGTNSLSYQPPSQNRYYQLVVTDGACGQQFSNVIQISLGNDIGLSFNVTGEPTSALCPGSSFTITNTSTSLAGLFGINSNYVRYVWSANTSYITSPVVNPYGTTEVFYIWFWPFTYFEGVATFTVHNTTNAPVTVPLTITPNIYNSSGNLVCSLTPYTINVVINPTPAVNSVSNQTYCAGDVVTPAAFSGTIPGTNYSWTNSNAGIGLGFSGSGNLPSFTAVNNGTSPISGNVVVTPTYTNGGATCSGSTKSFTLTVNPKPTVNSVSDVTVCNGASVSSIAFGSNVSGVTYNWTNSNPAIGLAASGTGNLPSFTAVNTGNSNATATISVTATYTNNAVSCPGPVRTFTITVNPDVNAGVISGTNQFCIGATAILSSNGTSGGTWSSDNAGVATVDAATGEVTAVSQGTANIIYTINSGCNSPKQASYSITVNPNANSGVISGSANMCIGTNTGFTTSGDPGGNWSSNNASVVTVNATTGVVTAIAQGSATISYTPSGCNPVAANFPVMVDPDANAGTVTGAASLCVSATSTFSSNGDAGGVWSSSNASVATVNSSTGEVTAIATGSVVISYQVSTGCNAPKTASANLTVQPSANSGSITGISPMCPGISAFYFSNGDPGSWSSTNPSIASVNPTTGLVTTHATGTCDIVYTVSAGCNSPVSTSFTLTVNQPAPGTPGTITGQTEICANSSSFIYAISSVANATSYIWTVPSGWSIDAGQGSTSITVTSGGTAGTISVVAANSCGNSSPRSLAISVIAQGTWTGTMDSEWHHAQNWCGGVPTSSTNVRIPVTAPHQPRIHVPAYTNDLSLDNGASLDVDDNLQVHGSITAYSNIEAGNGTIELAGSSDQYLGANLFVNDEVDNLVINNSGTAHLNGKLDIYRSLNFGTSGSVLETNGYLTLKSTNSGTAWVGNLTGKAVNGNVTVERYIPNHSKAWQFLSAPITGSQTINQAWQDTATAPNQNRYPGFGTMMTGYMSNATSLGFDVYTPTGSSIKVYDANLNTYLSVPNTLSTPISNKKGYLVFVRGDRSVTTYNAPATATVMRTKGKLYQPNNAPYVVNVQGGKFESVGNPYASAINFRDLTITGGVSPDIFYTWDPKLTTTTGVGSGSGYGFGAYQTFTWNGSSFDVTPGGGSYSGSNREIESGQAFFVWSYSAPGTVSFNESAKVSGSHLVTRTGAPKPITQLFTRLHARTAQGTVLLDGVRVQFGYNNSNEVNSKDVLKMTNGNENLAVMKNGHRLAVERRAMVYDTDTIYLNLTQVKVQNYQFEFIPSQLGNRALSAYIEDRYLNQKTIISLTDTTLFNFNVVNAPGSYAPDRFIIVFKKSEVLVPETLISISAFRNADHVVDIRWNVDHESNIQHYMVERSADGINFEGIVSSDVSAKMNGKYRTNDLNALANETWYRIKATTQSGDVIYSSVARVHAKPAISGVSIYPNPVVNGIANVEFNGFKPGKYSISLVYSNGAKKMLTTLDVSAEKSNHTVKLPAELASGIYQLVIIGDQGTPIVKSIHVAN